MNNRKSAVLLLVFLPLFAVATAAQSADFSSLDNILSRAVQAKMMPGAVCVIGHNGKVVYRKAFGSRSLEPTHEPMTVDTIFDLASLTKPIATAHSVMKLVQSGQVRLNDAVSRYIPEFKGGGKDEITVRQLLTHYSGLREDLDLKEKWTGHETAFRMAMDEKVVNPPGARFVYSDINYEVLGFLVERVSGVPLDQYAAANVFQPLGMRETRFNPPADWQPRIAPTEYDENGHMLRGVVHDPTARRMGGVAGHAGLFSTADDLTKLAQALLDNNGKVLEPLTIEKMTTPQQPANQTAVRGFGWDIDTAFATNRGELLPVGSYGHTGFTGTSIWIDPTTNTYVILLANGVHPRGGGGPLISLRARVATAAAAALNLKVSDDEKLRLARITGYNEAVGRRFFSRNGQAKLGIDVLETHNFDALQRVQKKHGGDAVRIGLVTNHTGLDSEGRRTIDVLAHAPGVQLAAIFTPEHGIAGKFDTTNIPQEKEPVTGTPVYSVYGATDAQRHPPQQIVDTLDAIVYDIQDIGVRYYTYETTLGYFLEAAAKANIDIFVLDRPNPITGVSVQGYVSDPSTCTQNGCKFVNYHPLPVRHGMTIGELGKLFNGERNINARLTVVPMEGWIRGDWFDSTGLTWTNPSPNMRSLTEATLYPGVALIEGANVSVGRGTDTPFELLGAPWIKARELASYLNQRQLAGVRFVPIAFTPTAARYKDQLCQGVNIVVVDRNALDAPELGVELAVALHKLYPSEFTLDKTMELIASKPVFDAIASAADPRVMEQNWREGLDQFQTIRKKYLIY